MTSHKRVDKESADVRPRFSLLLGAVLCLAISACAHKIPATLRSSVGSGGAFGTSAAAVGKLSWVRIYSYLPGPDRHVDWQPAATFGHVRVHAPPGGIEAEEALMLAKDIQSAIDYLYPDGDSTLPVELVDVYSVPVDHGANRQHSSMGRRGKLRVRFYLRNFGDGNSLNQRAYSAGTVAHELVHIERGLSGIPENDAEEPIAYLLETCSVLTVLGQVSPTFSQIASRSPASKREQELVSSARAAAELALSLPPTVHAGTEHAQALLASCAEHWDESRRVGNPHTAGAAPPVDHPSSTSSLKR